LPRRSFDFFGEMQSRRSVFAEAKSHFSK